MEKLTTKDTKELKLEIDHIFESGANEIRIFQMVKNFIDSRNEPHPNKSRNKAKAPKKAVKKASVKSEPKKAPSTLFGHMIKHSPKAHELSISLAMSGIHTDIPSADIILRVFNKMNEMGGSFDLITACTIRENVIDEYNEIERKFNESKKN
jgi:hypothetical protein